MSHLVPDAIRCRVGKRPPHFAYDQIREFAPQPADLFANASWSHMPSNFLRQSLRKIDRRCVRLIDEQFEQGVKEIALIGVCRFKFLYIFPDDLEDCGSPQIEPNEPLRRVGCSIGDIIRQRHPTTAGAQVVPGSIAHATTQVISEPSFSRLPMPQFAAQESQRKLLRHILRVILIL